MAEYDVIVVGAGTRRWRRRCRRGSKARDGSSRSRRRQRRLMSGAVFGRLAGAHAAGE
jgi:hypothetical protein